MNVTVSKSCFDNNWFPLSTVMLVIEEEATQKNVDVTSLSFYCVKSIHIIASIYGGKRSTNSNKTPLFHLTVTVLLFSRDVLKSKPLNTSNNVVP